MHRVDSPVTVETYQALKKQLQQWAYAYYVQDSPLVSDYDYDAAYQRLLACESQHPNWITPDSPSQRVGDKPLGQFEPVTLPRLMMSLDNVFDEAGLQQWQQRNQKLVNAARDNTYDDTYWCELKIDGLAVSLQYEHGLLTVASTRGNGQVGENITQNVRTIASVPLKIPVLSSCVTKIPDWLEVRGEIFMPKLSFLALNQAQREAGKPEFANPRNAGAGSVRQLDPKITASRRLDAYFYDVTLPEGYPAFDTQEAMVTQLAQWGFKTNPGSALCEGLTAVENFLQHWQDARNQLPCATDGVVVKLNNRQNHEKLGQTAKSPRWAVAYKYPPEVAQTTVLAVEMSVGRTGVITPVAQLQPVLLSGSTVSRASLHNFDEVERLGVGVGDVVALHKAAEIIPEILNVVSKAKDVCSVPRPQVCPACGFDVVQVAGEVALRCPNVSLCPAQQQNRLEHWASKGAMDIDGLGPALIAQLMAAQLVQTPADLYRLQAADLAALARMGEKSIQNILQAIQTSKTRPLNRLLVALGLRHVGKELALTLAQTFGTLEALASASFERLSVIEGVGEQVATSVVDFFAVPATQQLLADLHVLGVQPPVFERSVATQYCEFLAGKTVVITGTLPTLSRETASQLITQNGGLVKNSVSAKTHYLLAGDSAGSKLDKAEALGITVIDEATLLDWLK